MDTLKSYTTADLFEVLDQLPDDQLIHLAQQYGVDCSGYFKDNDDSDNDNTELLQCTIVNDFINRLLGKNKESYDPNELINITISDNQFNKAVNDISKNSIYFGNEKSNRKLFLEIDYDHKPIEERDTKYYFDVMKSIFKLYGINLSMKRRKINSKYHLAYLLSVDKDMKNIVDYKHKRTTKVEKYPSLFQR